MDPLTIGAIGASTLGGLLSGQGQPDPKNAGDVHLANAGQLDLYNFLLKRVMGGSGDFGMGAGVKQGKSQLAQFMADRGIAPQSGQGSAMYANMVGQAGADANQNRLAYAMNLLRSPLQTVQTAGSNWLPGSPSHGYSPDEQWRHYAGAKERYAGKYGRIFGGGEPYTYGT